MRTFTAGLLYFVAVFGAGFALGVARVLWLVPRLGERAAELSEMPLMLLVMLVASRWVSRRVTTGAERFAVGVVALALLLSAEFALVSGVRGIPLAEYAATRDPVSGTVYAAMLGLMAVLPVVASRSLPQSATNGS